MTTGDSYRPTEDDLFIAETGYSRYLLGVGILVNPEATIGLHGYAEIESSTEGIIVYAEKLMLGGLRELVKWVNSPEERGNLCKMAPNHVRAFPHILRVSEAHFDRSPNRYDKVSDAIQLVRPQPLRSGVTYRYLLKRLYKLPTDVLLDGLRPAGPLRSSIKGGRVIGNSVNLDATHEE
jgi:hypothetical protein